MSRANRGRVRTYNLGDVKLHVYRTNDFMDDVVYVLEKNGQAVVIENPFFQNNIRELTRYLASHNINVAAKFLSSHVGGASFLPEVPIYATRRAYNFFTACGGRKIMEMKHELFDKDIDVKMAPARFVEEGSDIVLAGIRLRILESSATSMIEMPEIHAVYIHMLCHMAHPIIVSLESAQLLIDRLEKYLELGYTSFMTGHHYFDNRKEIEESIDYFRALIEAAVENEDVKSFIWAMHARFPKYSGDYFLGMTAKMLFSEDK